MTNKELFLSRDNKLKILFILLPLLIGLSVDLYVPSLPAITTYYKTQISFVQLTITFYLLGYSAGQILLGTLSDYFGRKSILLISCIIYTLISFVSSLSPNIYFLIVYRLLQGIAIAGLGAIVRAVATDCFTGISLNKMMSCIALGWGLGPIVGPFLGSYLQYYFNWKANFIFLSLYGFFLIIYILLLIPETNKNLKGINSTSLKELCLNIKTILIHPIFIFSTILLSFIYSVLILFNITGPFLIETVLMYSIVDYGYMALFLGFGYFIGCYINKFLLNYIKPLKISIIAILSGITVCIIMIALGIFLTINLYIVLIPIFFLLFISGLIFPNIMSGCLGLFSNTGGTASAVYGTCMLAGTTIITAFATKIKINSQLPMEYMYTTMFFACLILFIPLYKFKKKHN